MNAPLIIIGGGNGTRMAQFMPDIPKLLLPLNGDETILSQITNEIIASKYYFALGKDANKINEYLETKSIDFRVSIEKEPMGTFGALKLLVKEYINELPDRILVVLGDLVCTEYQAYQEEAIRNAKKNYKNLFFYTKNNHPHDSDRIEFDCKDSKILKLYKKNEDNPTSFLNTTVSGLYYLDVQDILSSKINTGDIIMDYLPILISQHKAFAKQLLCNLNDVGSPERYKSLISNGSFKIKRKYLLIDLDGTLIEDRGSSKLAYNIQPELCKTAVKIIHECNNNKVKVIIITNQGDIAKGFQTLSGFKEEIRYIEEKLWNAKVWFDDIYFCPHYPEKGFNGEIEELKIKCDCRKPNIGMWKSAKSKWSINKKNTIFLGDSYFDEGFSKKSKITYFDIKNIKNIEKIYKFIGDNER
jgi:mannose-1-phosphate guanylyltransferase / phosphomannomutase